MTTIPSLRANKFFAENNLRESSFCDFNPPYRWLGKKLLIADKAWLIDQRRLKTAPRGSLEFSSLSLLIKITEDYGPRNAPFCVADDLFHHIRKTDYEPLLQQLTWLQSHGYIHFRK